MRNSELGTPNRIRSPARLWIAVALILIALPACERRVPPPRKATPRVTNRSSVPKPIEGKGVKPPATPPMSRDLDAITRSRALNVLFTFNSTGYFIYRGQTMGYEYDLINLFHKDEIHFAEDIFGDVFQVFAIRLGQNNFVDFGLSRRQNLFF